MLGSFDDLHRKLRQMLRHTIGKLRSLITGYRPPAAMKSDRGMDWVNMLLSGMGAAYGAFIIPVYLTSHAWTQTSIGLVLTVGTVVSFYWRVSRCWA